MFRGELRYNDNMSKGRENMEKIIFATGNAGKMKEIREILADLHMDVLSMKEACLLYTSPSPRDRG